MITFVAIVALLFGFGALEANAPGIGLVSLTIFAVLIVAVYWPQGTC